MVRVRVRVDPDPNPNPNPNHKVMEGVHRQTKKNHALYISPISPPYLPYISPMFPKVMEGVPHISPISPPYLPYISPMSLTLTAR